MTYQNIEEMSTDEIGEEYAKLIIISEYLGVNTWNDVERKYTELARASELEAAYRERPDAESLAAFLDCAFEVVEENGLKVEQ